MYAMCRIEKTWPDPAPQAINPVQNFGGTNALRVRLFSAIIFATAGSMLTVGMRLVPSPTGLGTHTQLGLPACGFYAKYGIPCPVCGYTTAVTYVAHGHLLDAIMTQPAGAAVGLLGVAAVVLGSLGLFSGRWYGPSLFWFLWHRNTIAFYILMVVLLSWMYKLILMSG